MKLFFLTSFISFSLQIIAQAKYYIEPLLFYKATISSTNPNYWSDKNDVSDSRIAVTNKWLFNNREVKKLFIGLNVGIQSNDEQNQLELGINNDESVAGFYSFLTNYDKGSNFQAYETYQHYVGSSYLNMHLNMLHRINDIPQKKDFFLKFGIGMAYRSSKNNQELNTWVYDSYLNTQSTVQAVSVAKSSPHRTSVLTSLGFQVDIKNSQKKYLFSTSLYYIYSWNFLNQIDTQFKVTTGQDVKFLDYHNYSAGSGFYLQLSRKFQIYPWIRQEKEKLIKK